MKLNGKDEIKELFQKELGNYQAKVNPNLWQGIQAGIGGTTAAVGTSMSLLSKIIIGGSIAAGITLGTIFIVKDNKNQEEKTVVEKVEQVESEQLNEVENTEEIESVKEITESNNNDNASSTISEKSTPSSAINNNEGSIIRNEEPIQVLETNTETQSITTPTPQPQTTESIVPTKIIIQEPKVSKPETSTTAQVEQVNLDDVQAVIQLQDNQFVKFKATNIPESAELVWDFGDGNFDNSAQPEHFYQETGRYTVVLTISADNKEVRKSIPVQIQIKGTIGELPNVFTPNGDGKNDIFFIQSEHLKTFQITVMDNNQKVVFSSNDPNFKWDGIDKGGNHVENGNYYYIVVAEDEAGNTITKYQQLTIQR